MIQQNQDGSFALNMDYFSFHHSTDRTFGRKFEELFGAPRPPKMLFFTEGTGFPKYFGTPPGNYQELSRRTSTTPISPRVSRRLPKKCW